MNPRERYPEARRLELLEVLHGHRIADPYRWLEDPSTPETREWAARQDALFAAVRAGWPDRERWRESLVHAFSKQEVGLPIPRRDRHFSLRRGPTDEHGAIHVGGPGAESRVLVDPMELGVGGTATLDAFEPSPSGDLLAYQISHRGSENSAIHVVDTASGRLIAGPIGHTRYSSVAWLPDDRGFYYAETGALSDDGRRRPAEVRLCLLDAAPGTDTVVFTAPEPGTVCKPSISADGRWLAVSLRRGAGAGHDLWIAARPTAAEGELHWRQVPLAPDARGTLGFTGASRGAKQLAYLLTTDGAPRGRICAASPHDLPEGEWREVVPEDPSAVLEAFAILDGPQVGRIVLVVLRTRHGVSELTLYDGDTGAEIGPVPLPGCGTVAGMSTAAADADEFWFSYTDFTTQTTIYHHDTSTGSTTLYAEADAGTAGRHFGEVWARQVSYESADTTVVRMFVVGPEEDPTRPRPTILTAYGGFGTSLLPTYTPTMLPWIRAGGIFAVASVRGGGEEGQSWHQAGRGAAKQNTIDDLHAAADWLVERGYTWAGGIGLNGASNGGLVAAAAITQRPERYAAAVLLAPVLDMVRYDRFGLGRAWREEYGSASDPDQLGWLLSYSPYHNVHLGTAYPAVMIAAFDGDTRVDPLHSRKFTAALQWATAGPGLVLLRRESDVGHAGRAVSRIVELSADALAFLGAQLGLSPPNPNTGRD